MDLKVGWSSKANPIAQRQTCEWNFDHECWDIEQRWKNWYNFEGKSATQRISNSLGTK